MLINSGNESIPASANLYTQIYLLLIDIKYLRSAIHQMENIIQLNVDEVKQAING